MKKVGYNETFTMYVYVDWKFSKRVMRTLKAAGYKCRIKRYPDQKTDDDEVNVTVTAQTANAAHLLISNIIH